MHGWDWLWVILGLLGVVWVFIAIRIAMKLGRMNGPNGRGLVLREEGMREIQKEIDKRLNRNSNGNHN